MSSANFVQVSGPNGRVQTLAAAAGVQTFLWRPVSLKGTLPGQDFVYADRIRGKVNFTLTRDATVATVQTPNQQQLAQILGQARVYSQFLGEIYPKPDNSIPILMNHDSWHNNSYSPPVRARGVQSAPANAAVPVAYEFEISLQRDYLYRSVDSCPWLSFFEGGEIEVDLAPSTCFSLLKWTVTGNVTMELNIDWHPDKQALVHVPVRSGLYRVVTPGPAYELKGVGAPRGLDGVVQGCRLVTLSWLFSGVSLTSNFHDNGFYAAFAGGGILPATAGINRIDVPFRDQVSIDAVEAWIGSFIADTRCVRHRVDTSALVGLVDNDLAQFPFCMDATQTKGVQSYVTDALDFWPMVWPGHNCKISDMQKVDGDLSFTASQGGSTSNVLNLFRTDEVMGFSTAKVMDLMDRMGLVHKARGGRYDFIPKYADPKRADDTTTWGMPLKIILA
jgi:hypothetical protein